jgi:hypothetical protein
MIAASEDRFFDPRRVRRLWRRWGKPEIHWYPTSHMGFLAHLPEALGVMREFIDRPAGGGTDAARSIGPTAVSPRRRVRRG